MAVTSIPTQGRSPTALIIQVLDPQALGEIVAGQATMEGTTTLLMDSRTCSSMGQVEVLMVA